MKNKFRTEDKNAIIFGHLAAIVATAGDDSILQLFSQVEVSNRHKLIGEQHRAGGLKWTQQEAIDRSNVDFLLCEGFIY